VALPSWVRSCVCILFGLAFNRGRSHTYGKTRCIVYFLFSQIKPSEDLSEVLYFHYSLTSLCILVTVAAIANNQSEVDAGSSST
jgi:hypothetical protein